MMVSVFLAIAVYYFCSEIMQLSEGISMISGVIVAFVTSSILASKKKDKD